MEQQKLIKFDGTADGNVWVAYKYPGDRYAYGTQLLVAPGQQAVLIKNGRVAACYDAGAYLLEAEGSTPLQGEGSTHFYGAVYFINKAAALDMLWGTATPFQFEDPKYGLIVSIRAHGKYGIRITEPGLFVTELVGATPDQTLLSHQFLNSYFNSLLISHIKSNIFDYMTRSCISFLGVTSHLTEISRVCSAAVKSEFSPYGIEVVNLSIETIAPLPSDFEQLRRMKEKYALGEKTYMKERQLDLLDKLAEGSGDSAAIKTVLESGWLAPEGAAERKETVTTVAHPTVNPGVAATVPKKSTDVEVFISFKNTYNDQPTPDAAIAAKVFEKLSSMGYNVFMMNETLYQKGVSNYKKLIDEALEEASCLIVIGSRREFVESEWVRYEWDTYLTEVLAGRKAGDNIFTLRGDGADISALPISLRKYQSFPISEVEQLYMWVSNALSGIGVGKKQRQCLLYPAVFAEKEAGGYAVTFPDLEIKAEGASLKDAFMKAKNLLEIYAVYLGKCGDTPPEATAIEDVMTAHPTNTVMYVDAPLPEAPEEA
ncbi:MAG: TIR domain-containing protein [Ruminococcaceae bacterium]|nr:TIR domain-containing protein [Oscillospiraceae bacterium]